MQLVEMGSTQDTRVFLLKIRNCLLTFRNNFTWDLSKLRQSCPDFYFYLNRKSFVPAGSLARANGLLKFETLQKLFFLKL